MLTADYFAATRTPDTGVITFAPTLPRCGALHDAGNRVFRRRQPYENEYCVWVQVQDGLIVRVWKYLDVAHATGQFQFVIDRDEAGCCADV
ncbi:MAG: hypothetical protein VYA67_23330 [Actinomycetota bacterium]|uniref:Ketosteroid isomerase-related protein n=1 Tax=Mycobacterium lentiflavum TaxID=141349 RepID=A0ABY3UPR0_MYCLN|nr:hypothetical protein [Mycobacterium lentiflavum]MEE3066828.1 hypothetical protein [Actinomycetota bacterium]ULP40397.1 hypothetical protein MJO58_15390 [Mycobacterium lentiflavum]